MQFNSGTQHKSLASTLFGGGGGDLNSGIDAAIQAAAFEDRGPN